MTEFTASNGYTIDPPKGDLLRTVRRQDGTHWGYLNPHVIEALREFFLKERDDELGRWDMADSLAQRAKDLLARNYIIADERYSLDSGTYLSIIEAYEEFVQGIAAEADKPENTAPFGATFQVGDVVRLTGKDWMGTMSHAEVTITGYDAEGDPEFYFETEGPFVTWHGGHMADFTSTLVRRAGEEEEA